MEDIKKQKINKKEFEKLFEKYSDVIYRLCLYRTSSKNVAYDLAQETFLKLWNTMFADKEIIKPKQYIYQIARNLIIDYYKTRKTVSLDTLEESGFDPPSIESSPELMTEIILLKESIENLDEEFRDVVYMRFVERMKVKDIAHILDISENLVSVRINRGKKMLKEKFI